MSDSPPANGRWFHFVETVYGAWLYGDARGFRTRHHREHVDGDYKDPPPTGKYDRSLQRSQKLLKQAPVVIAVEWRPIIGGAVRERLEELGAFVLCVAQGGQHLHSLAKLPEEMDPRDVMGLAKKHATFEARERGWKGKLWARRGKEIRVRDRAHQLNVYRYILDHIHEGAWVWDRMNPTDGGPWA